MSPNLYYKKNHEFEALLSQVRPAKSLINNYNGKMIFRHLIKNSNWSKVEQTLNSTALTLVWKAKLGNERTEARVAELELGQ